MLISLLSYSLSSFLFIHAVNLVNEAKASGLDTHVGVQNVDRDTLNKKFHSIDSSLLAAALRK